MNPTAGLAPHHIALKVADLSRAEQFYTEVLGLPLAARHFDDRGNLRSVWLKMAGAILMLERSSHEGPTPLGQFSDDPPGLHLLAFAMTVGERERWREHLQRHGVAIAQETAFSLFFRDPEGNRLAVSHYPERATI